MKTNQVKKPADPRVGKRVELSPSCNLWMRGCKFGTVVRIDHDQLFGEVVVVRMDNRRVRKLQRLLPGSLQRYLP